MIADNFCKTSKGHGFCILLHEFLYQEIATKGGICTKSSLIVEKNIKLFNIY